ncbi:MAG: hypothetical protein AAGG08_03620 [Actinomycetota bacterium]
MNPSGSRIDIDTSVVLRPDLPQWSTPSTAPADEPSADVIDLAARRARRRPGQLTLGDPGPEFLVCEDCGRWVRGLAGLVDHAQWDQCT